MKVQVARHPRLSVYDMMNLDQPAFHEPSSLEDFEHFLTAAVLTRCLDPSSSPALELGDVEALINRLSQVVRNAAQAAKGAQRSRSNALPRHKLRVVAEHVTGHLEVPIRVAELAALVSVSPYHFSRQFRQATGLSPHQYVSVRRMQRAATLLAHTEMPVGLVAVEVGCADQSHFTKLFRRLFGCAPREFRNAVWNKLNQHSISPDVEARAGAELVQAWSMPAGLKGKRQRGSRELEPARLEGQSERFQ